MKKIFAIIVTAAVLVSGTTTAALAVPATPHSSGHARAAQSAAKAISDENVIEFFASSRGPIAERYPDLKRFVPESTDALSRTQLELLAGAYREVAPDFHEAVTERLQSGDPYATRSAVAAFQKASMAVASSHGSPDSDVAASAGEGRCALLVAVAVAAALWLGVVFFVAYAPDDSVTNDQFAAEIASSFQD